MNERLNEHETLRSIDEVRAAPASNGLWPQDSVLLQITITHHKQVIGDTDSQSLLNQK